MTTTWNGTQTNNAIAAIGANGAEWLEGYRDLFFSKHSRPTTLNDAQLIRALAEMFCVFTGNNVTGYNTLDETQIVTRLLDAEKAAHEPSNKQTTVAVSGNVEKAMLELAHKAVENINADTDKARAFNAEIDAALEAPTTIKMAPVVVMFGLRELTAEYDKKGKVTGYAMDTWPRSKSSLKPRGKAKHILPDVRNGLRCDPDWYEALRPSQKKNGGMVPKLVRWYNNLADDTVLGSNVRDRIKALNLRADNKLPDTNPYAAQYGMWNKSGCLSEIDRLERKMRDMGNLYGNSVDLHQRLNEWAVKLPLMTVEFDSTPYQDGDTLPTFEDATGAMRTIKRSDKPIVFFETANQRDYEPCTVPQFLAIDIDKAVADGGNLKACVGAMGEPDEGDSDNDAIKQARADTFDVKWLRDYAGPFGVFLLKKASDISTALLASKTAEAKAEANDLLLDLNDIRHELDAILGPMQRQIEFAQAARNAQDALDRENKIKADAEKIAASHNATVAKAS